ncbi:MAG: 50S ribosomal protein L10 [Spirochaetaceae bacterium]|nr:50S ribosomal protein L10 [Spirochaetaceae bacterium]
MAMRATKIQGAKTDAIVELKGKIGANKDFIFAEYRGITVEQISALRKQLREKNSEFHIVKNNFARIAFEELGFSKDVEPVLSGPTAVAFAKRDSNEVAKVLVDFAKEVPALKVKAGLVERDFLDLVAIHAYSKLPGRNQLSAMFMSAIRSPVQKLVYTLVALQEKLGGAEGAPEASAESAPAAPAPAVSANAEAPSAETPAQA